MSKKGKLILATALFGAALFGASCGGGGGGGATASAPPPPPPPAPPASDVAKVLVLAAKGISSPGATVGLYEGTIKSDGTVSWSSDKLPGENLLDYYHEFSNKSVLLYDVNDYSVYLYTAGTLNPVTTGVDVHDDTIDPTPLTSSAFSSSYNIFLPNFLVMDDGADVDVIITSNGKIVTTLDTGHEHIVYAGRDYLVVGNGDTSEYVYIIKRDGSVTILDWDDATGGNQPINGGGVRLLDRVQGTDIILLGHTSTSANAVYVILEDGTPIRITNSTNASTGDDPVANIDSGKIMRDTNGNIFVAINYTDGTYNLIEYFKIIPSGSGSVVFTPPTPINLGKTSSNPLRRGGYALDGNGRLYVITNPSDTFNITTRFIDASNSLVTGPTHTLTFSGTPTPVMLTFANGVLVSNNPTSPNTFYHVLGTSAPTNVALNPDVIQAVSLCNQVNNESDLISENEPAYSGIVQEPVVGEGTNRLMCASAARVPNQFAWVEASGTGTYNGKQVSDVNGSSLPGNSYYLMATANSMIFWYDDQTFQECTLGASSCATRNLSRPVYWDVYASTTTIFDKIKSDNNVLSDGARFSYGGYWRGRAPNIRAVYFTNVVSAPYTANIQTGAVDTSTLNVVFSNARARGGNISLELDKAANVRSPISGAQCPIGVFDYVWYKDATRNFTNLARPTNTCLIRVLQVRTP
ncbi:MAG: hypothetical protein GU344_03800 [Thermocrinis sp.]|jgi:hypothetical protein|nr:hypothetical protein [Thermocrinis sp.]